MFDNDEEAEMEGKIACPDCGWAGDWDECYHGANESELICPECYAHIN